MIFASKNYVLSYRPNLETEPEPMLWDLEFRPTIPAHLTAVGDAQVFRHPTSVPLNYTLPIVNIDACRISLDSLFETWDEIPNLVAIDGHMPSMERYEDSVTNIGMSGLIYELKFAHTVIQSDYLYQVDWEKISLIYHLFEDEEFRWAHLLIYANRYNPASIKLAPIMSQEIIDTICNYYHFANWVMTAIKIDPVKFKSENFVLLRIN
jgi:hypothetical protein